MNKILKDDCKKFSDAGVKCEDAFCERKNNICNNNEDGLKTYIQFLRCIAAFLVIVNHTNSTIFLSRHPSATWFASVSYLHVCRIAVPVFLMILGGLLLDKKDSKKKSLKRILRCISVLVIFTVINFIYLHFGQEVTITGFLQAMFGSVTNAYWYLYLYLGLLVMLPFLQKFVQALTKKELEILLFISLGIGGILPFINVFTGITVNVHIATALLSPYWGMVFLGYYIEKYMHITRKIAFFSVLIFIVLMVLQVLLTYWRYNIDSSNYMQLANRIFVIVTLSSGCVYIFTKYFFSTKSIPPAVNRGITYAGSLTFGIYLLGDMFIKILSPVYILLQEHMHVLLAVIIYELLIYGCGAICTILMKQISFVKKLI